MFDAIKPLLDSGLINEDVSKELNEAWESKLTEAREQVRAELREEFAQRYEHDKSVMVEALDKMVTEGLQGELEQIAAEKQALAEDRVKFNSKMKESAQKFNGFLVQKLAEEIGELRKDRKMHAEGLEKLEGFVVQALAREIMEFAQDKKDVVATKVRLVKEAREQLVNLKARFVKESANKMSQSVSRHLKAELNQLQEDIKIARENNFGRKIFEAVAAEYMSSYLSEGSQVKKLSEQLKTQQKLLAETQAALVEQQTLVESARRETQASKAQIQRVQTLNELLSPLARDKRKIMENLLVDVKTSALKESFHRYLPTVLESRAPVRAPAQPKTVAHSGDRVALVEQQQPKEDREDLQNILYLAGLAKA